MLTPLLTAPQYRSFRRLLAALSPLRAGDWLDHPALLAFAYARRAFRSSRDLKLIAVTTVIGATLVPVASARADVLPGGCTSSAQTVTCSYAYTGGEQQFTVPVGVRSLHVVAVGARGFSPNAYGGEVTADLAVTPGQSLFVEVGGPGGAPTFGGGPGGAGGFNGGGEGGGAKILGGGGGGGASDVRTCSSADSSCDSLGSRLIVAAGGGGNGGNSVGGNGGDPNGHDASPYGPYPLLSGYGATQAAPGPAGNPDSPTWGTSGAAGQGGQGGGLPYTPPGGQTIYQTTFGGGGGGGGYYGGGGGFPDLGGQPDITASSVTGGGGGSSWGPAGATYTNGTSADPASVTIEYTPDTTAPTISISAPQDGAAYSQNQHVTADYSCSDERSGSGVASCSGTVPAGQPLDTMTVGQHAFTVTSTDVAGNRTTMTVHYVVNAAQPPPPPGNPPTGGGGTPPDSAGPPPNGGGVTPPSPGGLTPPSGGSPAQPRPGAHNIGVPRVSGLRLGQRQLRLRVTGAALVDVMIDRHWHGHWRHARLLTIHAASARTVTRRIRRLSAGSYRLTIHVRTDAGRRAQVVTVRVR